MKVIDFEDKNIKYVILDSGKYLIDDEVVNVDRYGTQRVKVKDEKNIRKIYTDTVVDHYLNIETNEKISEYDYNKKISEMLENADLDEYDGAYKWKTLEDEYAYKKYKSIHKLIHKNIQTISDPFLVEIVKSTYDTKNEFITNAFLNGSSGCDLFEYNQSKAWLNIVVECFNELHMEFNDDCGYIDTKSKKIWGNSSHSCIRYVVAFGGYVFNDEFKNPRMLKGTLSDMQNRYNHDKNKIRKIIKTKYNIHFGKIDEDNVDFSKVLNSLYSLRGRINDIESKKATWNVQNRANKDINDLIEYLESKYD